MIVAQPPAVPMEEDCAEVEAANARSAEEFAVAERAHSGWALADCSAVLPAHDSARAVGPAGPWAGDSVPACLVPAGSVVLTAHGSTPAGFFGAGRSVRAALFSGCAAGVFAGG